MSGTYSESGKIVVLNSGIAVRCEIVYWGTSDTYTAYDLINNWQYDVEPDGEYYREVSR
jgi:hypothetical protein